MPSLTQNEAVQITLSRRFTFHTLCSLINIRPLGLILPKMSAS